MPRKKATASAPPALDTDTQILYSFAALAELPQEERDKFIEELKAQVGADELTAILLRVRQNVALPVLARADTPEGFYAFFEFMTGMELHTEAKEKWVPNIYQAHTGKRGALTKAFRESAKSTVLSKYFSAFRIGHLPQGVGGLIRINDQKAQETAGAIAHLIEFDPRWRVVFPHVVPDKERGWGAETGYYVKDSRMSAQEWAKACDGRPDGPTWIGRGWRNGSNIGSHYNNFLCVDDILDENNTSSFRELQAVTKFYTDTLSKTVMAGCFEYWCYTPWLETDTYAWVENTGAYILVATPVMRRAKEGEAGATYWPPTPLNPDYPEAGNIPLSGQWWALSWPEVFDFERIAKEYRTGGAVGFARMMLLDLAAMKGLNLKAEWLHEYPAEDIQPSWPVVFGVDYASTSDKLKQKARDNFSLSIKRAIPRGGLVLIDGYLGKLSKGEALDKVASYAAIYPTLHMIGVENIGKGEEFYNDLLLINDTNGRVLPLMPIQHGRRSKGDRFENWLAPRYRAARCWISNVPTPFLIAFRAAWIAWPNGLEDDSLDADYMATFAGEGFLPNSTPRTSQDPLLPQTVRRGVMSSVFGRA